jgi:hypothetical protein
MSLVAQLNKKYKITAALTAAAQESISVLYNHIKKNMDVHADPEKTKELLNEIGEELVRQAKN